MQLSVESIIQVTDPLDESQFIWDDEVVDEKVALLETLISRSHPFAVADFPGGDTSLPSYGRGTTEEAHAGVRKRHKSCKADSPQTVNEEDEPDGGVRKRTKTNDDEAPEPLVDPEELVADTSPPVEVYVKTGQNKRGCRPTTQQNKPTTGVSQARQTRSVSRKAAAGKGTTSTINEQTSSTGFENSDPDPVTLASIISELKRWIVERDVILKKELKEELISEMAKRFNIKPAPTMPADAANLHPSQRGNDSPKDPGIKSGHEYGVASDIVRQCEHGSLAIPPSAVDPADVSGNPIPIPPLVVNM